MDINQALAILNKNMPAIYNDSRLGEPLAKEAVRAYYDYVQAPNDVSEELLVNNVQALLDNNPDLKASQTPARNGRR